MIGLSSATFESSSRKEKLEERVFSVAEEFGLDVENELREVDVKYLESYVNARTRLTGEGVKIEFSSSNFFGKSEREQRRIILHELIHVKQFNNSLDEWAVEEFDVSEDFADELKDTIWQDVKDIEGETELLVSNLMPGEVGSSYPYQKRAKEAEMESKGFDPESELLEGVEDDIEEVYREVKSVEIDENIYVEEGSINGQDYKVAVMGEYAAEKGPAQVEEYLEENIEGYEPESYEGDMEFGSTPAPPEPSAP